MNFDMFLPYVSRLVASAVAGVSVTIAHKIGIGSGLDSSTANGVGTFVAGAVYSLAHKFLDKRINPADVASITKTVGTVVSSVDSSL